MKRNVWIHSALGALLLAACGEVPEAGLAVGEELGTQEAALCSGATVTQLGIQGVSSYGGEVAASGSWTVSSPANAVRLEYYVNGVQRSVDQVRHGASGTWFFSSLGMTCATHTFEVRAFPMVVDSAGNQTVCTASMRSATQSFTQTCPTASLSCTDSYPAYVDCTGSGGGGVSPYTYFWQQELRYPNGMIYNSGWYQGGATDSFYCVPAIYRDTAVRLSIRLKVRDSTGMESTVRTVSRLCEP